MYIDRRRLYHLDWYLILNGLVLLAIGFINLASATRSIDTRPYNLLLKQVVALCMGVAVLFLILYLRLSPDRQLRQALLRRQPSFSSSSSSSSAL